MNIFEAVCNALREDGRAGLATIVGTTGSTPAPSQSRMLIRWPDGVRSVGTVGGGCLDESIRWCLTEDPARMQTRIRSFELNDELGDTGLICGGTVHVLLEMLDASEKDLLVECGTKGYPDRSPSQLAAFDLIAAIRTLRSVTCRYRRSHLRALRAQSHRLDDEYF